MKSAEHFSNSLFSASGSRELDSIAINRHGISGYELMNRALVLHTTSAWQVGLVRGKYPSYAAAGITAETVTSWAVSFCKVGATARL